MLKAMLRRGKLASAQTKMRVWSLGVGQPVWVALHLFKAYVESSYLYGCEVWGTKLGVRGGISMAREFETLQVQFLKNACGVSPTTPTPIVFAELGARPVLDACWVRVIKFWNELRNSPEDDMYRRMLMDNLRDTVTLDVRNWSCELIKGTRKIGFDFPLRCDLAEHIDLDDFQRVLQQRHDRAWADLSVCPRSCASQVRLVTYQSWFSRPQNARISYLKLPVSASDLRLLMRFRMGCHALPVETGRHHNIPRSSRVCTHCTTGSVGDERHLLFECPALQSIRDEYASLMADSRDCMRLLMWHKDQMRVFKYVRTCLNYGSQMIA